MYIKYSLKIVFFPVLFEYRKRGVARSGKNIFFSGVSWIFTVHECSRESIYERESEKKNLGIKVRPNAYTTTYSLKIEFGRFSRTTGDCTLVTNWLF